jgi:hypothetical protein
VTLWHFNVLATRYWSSREGNNNLNCQAKKQDQPRFNPRTASSPTRSYTFINGGTGFAHFSTKTHKLITVGKVSMSGSQICKRFQLILPKFFGSNVLGFGIKASNHDISLYDSSFYKPRLALHSTWNVLQNAYKHSSNHEVRKITLNPWQCWVLMYLRAEVQNSWRMMIGEVDATCSLARICL